MTISKKTLGGVSVVLIAAIVGAYFAFFSSKGSEIRFAVATSSMASNASQTVSGSVSPAESGRVVSVEAMAPGGTWTEVARVATDPVGAFKATFPMATRGDWAVRASVDSKGRQGSADAKAVAVAVLDPTQLDALVPKFARADKPLRISGRVTPAAARTITIETSTDAQTFISAGTATANAQTGQFSAEALGLKPGTVTIRVVVGASSSAAAVQGPNKAVRVEDYKAAGKKYLAIALPVNKVLDEYDAVRTNLAKYKDWCARASTVFTKQARLFRGYAFWPQEVKKNIEIMAKSSILYADLYSRLSKVKSFAATYDIDEPTLPKGSDSAAALIRAALGLPKRN